jgi:hypothetical protein
VHLRHRRHVSATPRHDIVTATVDLLDHPHITPHVRVDIDTARVGENIVHHQVSTVTIIDPDTGLCAVYPHERTRANVTDCCDEKLDWSALAGLLVDAGRWWAATGRHVASVA